MKSISNFIVITTLFIILYTPVSNSSSDRSYFSSDIKQSKIESVIERFSNKGVISEIIEAGSANGDTYRKITLINVKSKYPFIRVEDIIRVNILNSLEAEQIVDSKAMVADHVIVTLKPGVREEELLSLTTQFKGRIRKKLDFPSNTYLVSFKNYTNFNEYNKISSLLKNQDIVKHVGPDYLTFTSEMPNDQDFDKLWGLYNTGQTGGAQNSDIHAPEAWDITKGSRDVTVAVIDTGVDYNHSDLHENMWMNPGEVPGNGIDDDENGFVDDVYGWDFANNDNDPMDDNMHGTHCAGVIGAVANNGIGIAGVNWNVRIAALKFLDSDGYGALSDAAQALNYAVKMNIPITSNSWGGRGSVTILEEAFKNAGDNGVLSIVSAGNSNRDVDIYPQYPAAYTFPNIISVAATDHNDSLAWFSNYGRSAIDVAAPGVNIFSTIPNNQYLYMDGTSMAAPYVSGAAALIKSYNKSLTNMEIKDVIMNSVDPIDSMKDRLVSGGRLNIYRALKSIVSPPTPTPEPVIGELSVMVYNPSKQNQSNSIYTDFLLTNSGSTTVKLADVKLRYYYTIDGEREQNFWSDWSTVGNSNIKGTFVKMHQNSINSDYYLEIGFTEDAGFIVPGNSVVIKSRFAKADWSNYNQLNDFSFNPAANYFIQWDKVSAYMSNTLVWGAEPSGNNTYTDDTPTATPTPTPTATMPTTSPVPTSGSLVVHYYPSSTQNLSSSINSNIKLVNRGDTAVNLADVNLRYYYTIDGEKEQNFWCDWSNAGSVNVIGKFVKLTQPVYNADNYVVISFTGNAGMLMPEETVEIRFRISKSDWSSYNQSNDFSFNPLQSYTTHDKVSAYISGSLVWGIEP